MYSALSAIAPSREQLYAALEAEHGSAYLLGSDLSLQYVNEGWLRFARENGAPELANRTNFCAGKPITAFFAAGMREFFAARFLRAIDRNETWSSTYECSSPSVYRKFNMRATPTSERNGLVVVHSLAVEARLEKGDRRLEDGTRLYTDARGLIVQCSACGRVHNPAVSSWDWAPGLVGAERQNVSHGICPTCDFRYYGADNLVP